ncbi:hypothetical protein Y032_1067g3529 [Ancylostoma ceylanicum]|uniref:Uncharacterized protein n=1 Tax=Ancylostoma ceylanicum TaxID=53326 RepID=A0A016W710_9BILA|nr:hypothetical protein Y032_1067g3529 [Ancylostoma ceylanicum]
MLVVVIVSLLYASPVSSQCTASSPWTQCYCGSFDSPQGVYQLITGFVSPSTIKSAIAADEIHGSREKHQLQSLKETIFFGCTSNSVWIMNNVVTTARNRRFGIVINKAEPTKQ